MPAAVNWEAAPAGTQVLSTELNSLANNTITAASAAYDNSANLDVYAWFELNVTFGTNPSDTPPMVDLYMARSLDGTNYESAPVTGGAGQQHMFVGSFQVLANTSAQRVTLGPVLLPPCAVKFYLDNQTGQTMAASGNTLHVYPNNLESQ